MGIFSRRRPQPQSGPQPTDRIEWVTATARRILAERGVETTVAHGAQPEDVMLVASDGMRYPLFNAFAKTRDASAAEASRLIADHLGSLLASAEQPAVDQLTAEQLRQQVRTRLLTTDGGSDGPSFRYARPFSGGLALALCVDYPHTVAYLTDQNLEGVALDLDELYSFGQLNTDREPVGELFEPVPGITAAIGDSLFIASKAANLPAVFGAAPFGTLFSVPHRHLLIALPITGPATLPAVEHLVAMTRQAVGGGPVPGGILSLDVHFSRDGSVSQVSRTDEAGAVAITVDEPLQRALEEALA